MPFHSEEKSLIDFGKYILIQKYLRLDCNEITYLAFDIFQMLRTELSELIKTL